MCTSQPLNYTIVIEDIETEQPDIVAESFHSHTGPGAVTHNIDGLKGDHSYSVSVEVSSFSWTSLSGKYKFGEAVFV